MASSVALGLLSRLLGVGRSIREIMFADRGSRQSICTERPCLDEKAASQQFHQAQTCAKFVRMVATHISGYIGVRTRQPRVFTGCF